MRVRSTAWRDTSTDQTINALRRYKSGETNENNGRGFRIAWTAVKLPGLIQDASGHIYGAFLDCVSGLCPSAKQSAVVFSELLVRTQEREHNGKTKQISQSISQVSFVNKSRNFNVVSFLLSFAISNCRWSETNCSSVGRAKRIEAPWTETRLDISYVTCLQTGTRKKLLLANRVKQYRLSEEPCHTFHCEGGEYCIDTQGLLCNPLPRYCIADSLRCNDVPNCGAFDHSDESACEYMCDVPLWREQLVVNEK